VLSTAVSATGEMLADRQREQGVVACQVAVDIRFQ